MLIGCIRKKINFGCIRKKIYFGCIGNKIYFGCIRKKIFKLLFLNATFNIFTRSSFYFKKKSLFSYNKNFYNN